MIEYASMTCSHCAGSPPKPSRCSRSQLYRQGQGALRLARISARSARRRRRHAGPLLGRQARGDGRTAVPAAANWAFVNDPLEALRDVVKQTGMGKTQFEACLNDQACSTRCRCGTRWPEKFKVNATPTFFINGDKRPGEIPPQALDKLLAPYLNEVRPPHALSAAQFRRPFRHARANRRRNDRRPFRRRAARRPAQAPLDLPLRKSELEVERRLRRWRQKMSRRARFPFSSAPAPTSIMCPPASII